MPTYDYQCGSCKHNFFEVRGIKDYSDNPITVCPKCASKCDSEDRDFSKTRPQFIGTSVQNAEYNPGLGCVVKDKYHKEELCRQKGLVEVGNDFNGGDSMQKYYDKKKKEELESKWQDPKEFFL